MMSDPDASVGYAAAKESYLTEDWKCILPLQHGTKWPPPDIKCTDRAAKPPRPCKPGCECIHYTGHQAVVPSYADLMAWSEDFPDGNLCLRLPDGIIGIDVDDYGAKEGAKTFAEAIRRWGPLPDAPRTTSRDGNLISGIRLFAVPLGTTFRAKMDFPELGIGDCEIVQSYHRYAVAWPSIHPEGGQYWWRNDAGQLCGIPNVANLPKLPQTWIDGLSIELESNLEYAPIDVATALTRGEPSAMVRARLAQAVKELNLPGCSRHDTATKHVMALMRMGKNGESGVDEALAMLGRVLIAIRAADGSGDETKVRGELRRMIFGDNLRRELARPDMTDWVRALIIDEPQADERQPLKNPQVNQRQLEIGVMPTPAEVGIVGNSMAPSTNAGCIVDDSRPTSPLEAIEQGFWQSRASLASIYQTALARMASPWAVLGICAARALTQVRPTATLPPFIGGPGSLNWFLAIVARSGGGKGAASAASNLLIPKHTFKQKTIGSGEGLVKLFDRPKNAEATDEINEAILINVDEVDTLTALSQRSASTTIAVLKQAFMGESLGFTYVNRANVRDVEDHGYRMTLVVSVQPRKSGGLFADSGGGLPQRFMWLPAGDKRIDMAERWPSTPLTLPKPSEWLYPREISIPAEAELLIRQTRVDNGREEADALDGHALFCREKFAYALTVLDGRVQMTLEDWQLSGIAAAVSDHTRQKCIDDLEEAARLDAVERGALRGVEIEAADVEKLQQQIKRGQRVLKWLLHKLDEAPEGWLTQSEIARRCAGRDGSALKTILEQGHETLRAQLVDGVVRWSRA